MIVLLDYESSTADPDFRVSAWLKQQGIPFYHAFPGKAGYEFARPMMTSLIISGGPFKSRDVADSLLEDIRGWQNLPILGICLGCMAIVRACGGDLGNYAQAPDIIDVRGLSMLGSGVSFQANAAHREKIIHTGPSLKAVLWDGAEVVGVVHRDKPIYGVMFHPESRKTSCGDVLLNNFLSLS